MQIDPAEGLNETYKLHVHSCILMHLGYIGLMTHAVKRSALYIYIQPIYTIYTI